MRITHRVGHALTTRGKQSPDGVKEWAQAEPIAKLVIAELNNYEGVVQKRVDDPTGKVDKSLSTLVAEVNNFKADVHIDYHLNAHGNGATWTTGHGTEVFVNTRKPKEAVELATKVLNNIVSATGFRNRGVKFYDWEMVKSPKATNILVEICFMTNKDDVSIVRSTDGQIKIAAAIVEAVVSQYKLKRKKEVVKPKEVETLSLQDVKPKATPSKGIGVVRILQNTVLREEPVYTSPTIRPLKKDQEYHVYGIKNGWFNGGSGWIHSGSVFFLPTRDLEI